MNPIFGWLVAGVILIALEPVIPGFFVFFVGLGALTVSLISWAFGLPLVWQWILFPVFSGLYILLLMKWVRGWFSGSSSVSANISQEYIGRIGKITETIQPPNAGRVMVGETEWNAVCDVPVEAGASVKIVAQENLTFKVEKI